MKAKKEHSAPVPKWTATIWVGFRVRGDPRVYSLTDAAAVCAAYCNEVGLCVSVTPTQFVYVGGIEPGCAVGLIDYPRFPEPPSDLERHALELGERLRVSLGQERVSVVLPDRTVMLGEGP